MPFAFETKMPGFDQDNAYYLVKACEISYQKEDALGQAAMEILELKEDSILALDKEDEDDEMIDYHGFAGSTDKLSILVFRGTASLNKWLTDSTIVQRPGYGGLVHKGFADGMDSFWGDVEAVVKEQKSENGLWLAGHGLGGALAVLAAARLHTQGTKVNAVYTFGAPRVGNVDFFFSYPVPVYRIVYNNDIFAHVPPEHVCVGGFNYCTYKHVGTLRYFDRHKQLGEGTSNWAVKKEMVRQRLLQLGQPPSSWFEDHHISNYVELFTPPEEE